jgi:hypothetical protein
MSLEFLGNHAVKAEQARSLDLSIPKTQLTLLVDSSSTIQNNFMLAQTQYLNTLSHSYTVTQLNIAQSLSNQNDAMLLQQQQTTSETSLLFDFCSAIIYAFFQTLCTLTTDELYRAFIRPSFG